MICLPCGCPPVIKFCGNEPSHSAPPQPPAVPESPCLPSLLPLLCPPGTGPVTIPPPAGPHRPHHRSPAPSHPFDGLRRQGSEELPVLLVTQQVHELLGFKVWSCGCKPCATSNPFPPGGQAVSPWAGTQCPPGAGRARGGAGTHRDGSSTVVGCSDRVTPPGWLLPAPFRGQHDQPEPPFSLL